MLAPEAIDSVIIASHFGLIFVDADGFLRGWIDPTPENPGVWDLHLMPGERYPDGHEPRTGETPGSTPGRGGGHELTKFDPSRG